MVKKKKVEAKKHIFNISDKEFSRENMIEGGFVRPLILMGAFFSFLVGMFLLLLQNYQWGGSCVIFSFVLNMYSIYESLKDEASVFKNLNLGFKFTLFLFEILTFSWFLATFLNQSLVQILF